MNFHEIWESAREELRRSSRISLGEFESRIKNIHIRESEDGVLTLVAPSVFDTFLLIDNYSRDIEKALFSAAGTRVEFRIVEPDDADGSPSAAGTAESSARSVPAAAGASLFSAAASSSGVPASRAVPAVEAARPPLIDSRYTFEKFVVSAQNEMAFTAAMNAAMRPKETEFNPIFLFGPTGVGKTHLMHAIANKIFDDRQKNRLPPYRIVYVTSEAFTNDFLNTVLREKNAHEFNRRYREADVLLVDDIQFFSGKPQMQETFFHTFNDLITRRCQVILTSDRPANDIAGLEDRLVSRFQSGLSADIQPPSLETRLAILRQKAEERGFDYAHYAGVLEFVAQNISHSVRDLEGAVNTLSAFVKVRRPEALSIPTVEQLLQSLIIKNHTKRIDVESIQRRVAELYKVPETKMKMRDRTALVAFARQVAMYLCSELTDMKLVAIGEAFGGRDHGTVIHAKKTVKDRMDVDADVKRDVEYLKKQLSGYRS